VSLGRIAFEAFMGYLGEHTVPWRYLSERAQCAWDAAGRATTRTCAAVELLVNDVYPDEIDEDPPEGELDPDQKVPYTISLRLEVQTVDAARVGQAFNDLARELRDLG
jgi:hypothetical protein